LPARGRRITSQPSIRLPGEKVKSLWRSVREMLDNVRWETYERLLAESAM
jgi:hypothetical protein